MFFIFITKTKYRKRNSKSQLALIRTQENIVITQIVRKDQNIYSN